MKKKQKQHNNPQKDTFKDLQYLQKKLGEEKQNLMRENKKLQKQIHEQIQENRLLKLQFSKKQKQYEAKILDLRRQIQDLKTQLLLDKSQGNHYQQLESTLKQTKGLCTSLTEQNEFLKNKMQEFEQIMDKMEADINNLQKQNNKYKWKIKDEQAQIKNLGKEMEDMKQLYKQSHNQSQKTIRQLDKQVEQNKKLEASLYQQKKKNRQINESLKMLQEKMQMLKQAQYERHQRQINNLKRQKDQLQLQKMELQRQLQFLKISEASKQQYIETITKQLTEIKHLNELNSRQVNDKTLNLQRVQNQNRRLTIDHENYKVKSNKQIEQLQKSHQDQIIRLKRKTVEDINSLLRQGIDNKALQNYMQGLRSHKSHMNLRSAPLSSNPKYSQQKINIPFQKFRYQNQILNLNSQIQNLRRQIQLNSQQYQKIKKNLQQSKQQNQMKNEKIKQLKLQMQKAENDKRIQVQKINKELIKLRNIQTELLQTRHEYIELQQATSLKIAYYDKKIKQYLQIIQRKENIIQGLKNQRYQSQNKAKLLEERLIKTNQQIQSLRRFKQDICRKDQLVKDYKQKVERYKVELENYKNEVQKFRKQKTRLERNLQSKEEYISTLKSKAAKQQQQKYKNINEKQQKKIKQIKQKYESKLKKLKRQFQEQFFQRIQSIKNVIQQKIVQATQKHSNEQNIIRNSNGWEAAELLGLKSNQIQQFINPTINMDRDICQILQQLWQKKEYQEFIRNSIQYLLLKNRSQPIA